MENIIERYKGGKSEVIQALQDTQKAYGYISKEHLKRISKELGSPYSYTYAIVTFYKSFLLQERGKYVIKVCDGTACHLKLSEDIVDELTSYLHIGIGGTTEDKLFTLEQVNCLGACAMAPIISINEKLYGKLTRKKVRKIIDNLKRKDEATLASKKGVIPVSIEEEIPIKKETPASTHKMASALSNVFEKGKQIVHKLGEFIDKKLEGK